MYYYIEEIKKSIYILHNPSYSVGAVVKPAHSSVIFKSLWEYDGVEIFPYLHLCGAVERALGSEFLCLSTAEFGHYG